MKMNSETLSDDRTGLDMRTVAALAKAISEGFPQTVGRQRAEYEILAYLINTDIVIDPDTRVPLSFKCRPHPPALWLDIEPRRGCMGVRVELTVEAFLKVLKGDVEARLLSRFALARIAQIGAKYGLEPSAPGVMREFANLDFRENGEAAWAAAFSLVTPTELECMLLKDGRINPKSVAQEAMIPQAVAEVVVQMFAQYREDLLSPCLPSTWRSVRFEESENERLVGRM